MAPLRINPSILAADFVNMQHELERISTADSCAWNYGDGITGGRPNDFRQNVNPDESIPFVPG